MLDFVRRLQSLEGVSEHHSVVLLPVPLSEQEEDEIYRNLELVTGVRMSHERPETEFVDTASSQEIPPNRLEDGDSAAVEQIRNEGDNFD